MKQTIKIETKLLGELVEGVHTLTKEGFVPLTATTKIDRQAPLKDMVSHEVVMVRESKKLSSEVPMEKAKFIKDVIEFENQMQNIANIMLKGGGPLGI